MHLLAQEVADHRFISEQSDGLKRITDFFRIRWHVALQTDDLPDPHGCAKMNEMIDLVPMDHWIWILDDDNKVNPDLFPCLADAIFVYPDKEAFVFAQRRNDLHGPVLHANPENLFAIGCDTAQVVFRKRLIGHDLRMREDSPVADTKFFQTMYRMYESRFCFIDTPLVYHNGRTIPDLESV